MSFDFNELLKGKRVYTQEGERDDRYLILSSDRIKKFVYLTYKILIKHGDLPYPKKWIRYFGFKPAKGELVPVEEFNADDYEYIFSPDYALSEEMKERLIELGYPTDDTNKHENFLILLDEIPDSLIPLVKRDIEFDMEGDKFQIVDCYVYTENEEEIYYLLDADEHINSIKEESTNEFTDKETLDVYSLEEEKKRLYNIRGGTGLYSAEGWYLYFYDDLNFPYLEKLYELEDVLPYTSFKRCDLKVEVK
jgi:hypothetical protein